MAPSLKELRVTAGMESQNYVSGMEKKIAADKAGAASSSGVGEALKQTDTKVSHSGDILSRLSRQYVEGYAAAQRFDAAISSLGRGIEKGVVPLVQAGAILDGIYAKYGLTANAAELMERGQVELAAAVDAANKKLIEQRDIVPANSNNRSGGFQATNVAYQLQDIISTAALGMSPLTVALQQGPQLASVFGETGAAGAVKTLGAAFVSLVSPVSLATIAFTGITAAAIQYFTSTDSGVKRVEAVLERHGQNIAAIKERYGDAAKGLQDYVREGDAVLQRNSADNLREAYKALGEEAKNIASYGPALLTENAAFFKSVPEVARQFQGAFVDLKASIAASRPDLLSFREEMSKIANDTSVPKNIRDAAHSVSELDEETLKLATAVPGMRAALATIGGAAASQISQVSELTKALRELAGIALPALTQTDQAEKAYLRAVSTASSREDRDDAYRAYQDAKTRIENQNPTVINGDGRQTSVPTPGARPNVELEGLPGAEKLAKQAAGAANAYRDLIKSAQDRVDQMKLEAELSGATGIAADTLRFKLDLLQQGEDKGRSLSAEQVKSIEAKAAAYQKYAEAAANANLKASVLFEREQLGRTAIDQTVASTLKSYGLPVDLNGAAADMIRFNEQLKEGRDRAGDFVGTLFDGIEQHKGVLKSLGDAFEGLFKRIAQSYLDNVLNQLTGTALGSSLFSWLGGGAGIGSTSFKANTTFGNFLQGIPGFAEGTENAPPGYAWVGERGIELVKFKGGEKVIPNSRLSSTFSQGSAAAQSSGTSAGSEVGRSVVQIALSPGLEASLLEKAGDQSIEIVRQNNEAQQNYKQNGGT